jgi:lysine-N-methylase
MKLRTPYYYKNFTCIAGKCVDNCCFGGWQIDIDDETIEKYSKVPGKFGDKLRQNVDADNMCFRLKDGKCPFLMSDNLCEIYKELGEDCMGVVCAQFPRFTEYFGDIKETGIGLACEEAARIILCTDCSFDLVTSEIDEEPVWGEYDSELGKPLFTLRDKLMKMMDDTEMSLSAKLLIILDVFNALQEMINENDYSAIGEYCRNFDIDTASDEEKNEDVYSNVKLHELFKSVWYSYLDLEPINLYWKSLSNSAFEQLYENNVEYFCNFNDKILADSYVRLVKYYLFRYMMKASFDHDLLGKAQLIIANIIIISDLTEYRHRQIAAEDGKLSGVADCCSKIGKNTGVDDIFMDVIHIFSRQIEYSEDNILELYDSFIFDEVFSYDTLKKVLLSKLP